MEGEVLEGILYSDGLAGSGLTFFVDKDGQAGLNVLPNHGT